MWGVDLDGDPRSNVEVAGSDVEASGARAYGLDVGLENVPQRWSLQPRAP